MWMLPRSFALVIAITLIALSLPVAADTGRLNDLLRRVPEAALPPGAPRLDVF